MVFLLLFGLCVSKYSVFLGGRGSSEQPWRRQRQARIHLLPHHMAPPGGELLASPACLPRSRAVGRDGGGPHDVETQPLTQPLTQPELASSSYVA